MAPLKIGVAALVLLLASCGGDDAGSTPDAVDEAELTRQREDLADRLSSGAGTELQREILADEFVSPAEADRAAADVIVCAQEQGVEVTASWDEGSRSMAFTTRLDRADPDRSQGIFDTCWDERYGLVGDAIAIQYSLTSEQTKQLENGMIECLARAGVEVSEWPGDQVDDESAESRCYDEEIAAISGE